MTDYPRWLNQFARKTYVQGELGPVSSGLDDLQTDVSALGVRTTDLEADVADLQELRPGDWVQMSSHAGTSFMDLAVPSALVGVCDYFHVRVSNPATSSGLTFVLMRLNGDGTSTSNYRSTIHNYTTDGSVNAGGSDTQSNVGAGVIGYVGPLGGNYIDIYLSDYSLVTTTDVDQVWRGEGMRNVGGSGFQRNHTMGRRLVGGSSLEPLTNVRIGLDNESGNWGSIQTSFGQEVHGELWGQIKFT